MKLRGKFSLLIGLVVLATFAAAFGLAASFQRRLVIGQAERQARMLSRQILLTRRWVSDHDGLFLIKKTGSANSNFPPGNDVVDMSGQVYVKRDPGMIIWELSDYASQLDFCRFRVTSLRPVNPENAPDAFERQSLLDFETGREEALEIAAGAQGRTLRYMIPLKVEESCLPCHAEHGYQVGNVRGGLSLEVPLGWADEAIAANNRLLLLVGLAGVALASLAAFLLTNVLVVRRLHHLAGAVDLYPQLPSPSGPTAGDDEIGELAGKFTAMGERLEAAQRELNQTREEMFNSAKLAAISRMAAGAGHEVNAPLDSMRQCLKDLKASPEDRVLRDRCLDLIGQGLQRLGHLGRQLLTFERESPLTPAATDIDQLIRDCLELLAFQLREIRLTLDLALSGRYLVDGGLLKQALINVALNAIQAMPGGGELRVSSREETELIVICVRDSGPGIPQADLDRIFEPFFTTRKAVQGRGLGLSVSYSLLKRLGGHIRVESRPGEGALFTLELPRQPAGAAPGKPV